MFSQDRCAFAVTPKGLGENEGGMGVVLINTPHVCTNSQMKKKEKSFSCERGKGLENLGTLKMIPMGDLYLRVLKLKACFMVLQGGMK